MSTMTNYVFLRFFIPRNGATAVESGADDGVNASTWTDRQRHRDSSVHDSLLTISMKAPLVKTSFTDFEKKMCRSKSPFRVGKYIFKSFTPESTLTVDRTRTHGLVIAESIASPQNPSLV